jgi:glycolate oxidase FAD binding subunit
LRWHASDADVDVEAEAVRGVAANAGGHATLFRSSDLCATVFHPLAPEVMKIHRRLKEKFDPMGILNPGRMYPEL